MSEYIRLLRQLWLRRHSGSSANQKVRGSIPSSSLGKILQPELLLSAWCVYESAYECVVKGFKWSVDHMRAI